MTALFAEDPLRSYALPSEPAAGTVLRGQRHLWTCHHKTNGGGAWRTPSMVGTFTWAFILGDDGPLYPALDATAATVVAHRDATGTTYTIERDPLGYPCEAYLVTRHASQSGPAEVRVYFDPHAANLVAGSCDGLVIGPLNLLADFMPKDPPGPPETPLSLVPAQQPRSDLPCAFGCGAGPDEPCADGCPAATARAEA
jgi:hypothetical protein